MILDAEVPERIAPVVPDCFRNGFTLTELAVVLVIVALLIGGMLMPLSTQRDIQNVSESQKQLGDIREALLGFAIINRRLPCPTTTPDPANAQYGLEDAACNNVEGYLPWKTLGLGEVDAWGTKRTAVGDSFAGYWRYRVDGAFATNFTIDTNPTSNLVVRDSSGNNLTAASPNSPVAIVYSTGPDRIANGDNVDTDAGATTDPTYQAGERSSTFDDMLIWIGRPVLINRMISAGRLP